MGDVPDGNAQNGQQLWQWECTDRSRNQQWHFDDGSWRITSGINTSMCIDAGDLEDAMESYDGKQMLFLWECNGLDQQVFGYDPDMQTIYLANTASKADASLCVELDNPA